MAVPWPERGNWVWEYLPSDADCAGTILPAVSAVRSVAHRTLPPYLREFAALWPQRHRLQDVDVLFAWELRTTLALAVLRRRYGKGGPKLVSVAPIFKGPVLTALPAIRPLLSEIDRFLCAASAECDHYSSLLRLPRTRFAFEPLAWLPNEEPVFEHRGFALALGRSNRDYSLLLKAVEGTGIPLTIVSGNDRFIRNRPLPNGVTVRCNTGHEETASLVADAMFHIIPLVAQSYSSGTTVLLRAMARGKAVILTDTTGSRDYVRSGENGILVPPGDVDALRQEMVRLATDTDLRRRLGEAAARTVRERFHFHGFASALLRVARELTNDAPHTAR
ncbi:MAG: glycosyltransferase family 4 protein [Capsulimonadales bacterium]|nr:glycosyltransferase family 4 protein [Capsulimonadales bacterium]